MQTFTINLKEHYGYLDKSEGLLDAYIPNVTPEIDENVMRPSIVLCPGGAYMYCSRRRPSLSRSISWLKDIMCLSCIIRSLKKAFPIRSWKY